MESNQNINQPYPNSNQNNFKPAQVDQSDPLGVFSGTPAPNSSQISGYPVFPQEQNCQNQPQQNYQNQPQQNFQNPPPQNFQNPPPQSYPNQAPYPNPNNSQMSQSVNQNCYPNYPQNQGTYQNQNQGTYQNPSSNITCSYQGMTGDGLAQMNQQRPLSQSTIPQGQPMPNYNYVPNSSVYSARPVQPINTNVKTSYPNGIVPPSSSVLVSPGPVIPVPVYTAMPLCMRCGGTGYVYGRRCVCIGGTPGLSNSELLGLGLLGMGLGRRPYYHHHHHGYW